MSCWRKECWQEKDRVHWLVLASQVVALLRSASENSQLAFLSEQASLTNAQGKSLDTQRTLPSPHSRGSEKWRKGQRNQICLTPGFPCKLINSELWSYWKVKFYPFQNLSWDWCFPAPFSHKILNLRTKKVLRIIHSYSLASIQSADYLYRRPVLFDYL